MPEPGEASVLATDAGPGGSRGFFGRMHSGSRPSELDFYRTRNDFEVSRTDWLVWVPARRGWRPACWRVMPVVGLAKVFLVEKNKKNPKPEKKPGALRAP